MNENEISELMRSLDNDLILQELDEIMADIDMDAESVSQRAHVKLRKEQHRMKKHKKLIMAAIAAALLTVCGVMTVYAAEISDFVQSLMGKTTVYATVVDGKSYYLSEPVTLEQGNRLVKAMFDDERLFLQLDLAEEKFPDLKIRINGKEMEPSEVGGYDIFSFRGVKPVDRFELIFEGKSYPVALTAAQPVIQDGEIIEAASGKIPWLTLGYKKVEGGIQILAATDIPSVQVLFFDTPENDRVTQKNEPPASNSQKAEFLPLLGYDAKGNCYVFQNDPDEVGWPLTVYKSNMPAGEPLTVELPSIVVGTDQKTRLTVKLPAVKEKADISQTIDLGLQTMRLDSVERTSETTARLQFTLNTGERENVRIWEAYLDCAAAKSTELLWENGTCVMDITFQGNKDKLKLNLETPTFIVDGDWTFHVA